MTFFRSNKFWLVVFILTVFFAIITGFLNQSVVPQGNEVTSSPTPTVIASLLKGLKVTSYQPLGAEKVTTQPTLKLEMNKKLGATEAEIRLNPSTPLKIAISGSIITATPSQPLAINTKYTASLYIDKGKFFEWVFTTIGSTISQNEAAIVDQIKAKMPYQGDKFRITYSSVIDQFTVTIDTKPSDTYFQKALDWFKSQGVTNLNSLNIKKYLVGSAAQS